MKTRRFQWTERLNLNPPERLILPISQKFPARFLHVQHLDLLAPLMPWWQLDPPHHLRCRLFTFSRQPSTPRLRPICYIKNAPIFHSKFGNENMTIFFFLVHFRLHLDPYYLKSVYFFFWLRLRLPLNSLQTLAQALMRIYITLPSPDLVQSRLIGLCWGS